MKSKIALIVFWISSISITGISFLDGKIWDIVFLIVGLLAYGCVGLLFSFGLISTKKQGREAYELAVILIILAGFKVYEALKAFREWLLSLPIGIKIAIPVTVGVIVTVCAIFAINHSKKKAKKANAGK